jgi:hypothetical protein
MDVHVLRSPLKKIWNLTQLLKLKPYKPYIPRLLPGFREGQNMSGKIPNQKMKSVAILISAWHITYILFMGVGVGALTPLNPLNPPISSLNLGYPKGGPIFSSTYPTKYFLIFQTLVQPLQ